MSTDQRGNAIPDAVEGPSRKRWWSRWSGQLLQAVRVHGGLIAVAALAVSVGGNALQWIAITDARLEARTTRDHADAAHVQAQAAQDQAGSARRSADAAQQQSTSAEDLAGSAKEQVTLLERQAEIQGELIDHLRSQHAAQAPSHSAWSFLFTRTAERGRTDAWLEVVVDNAGRSDDTLIGISWDDGLRTEGLDLQCDFGDGFEPCWRVTVPAAGRIGVSVNLSAHSDADVCEILTTEQMFRLRFVVSESVETTTPPDGWPGCSA